VYSAGVVAGQRMARTSDQEKFLRDSQASNEFRRRDARKAILARDSLDLAADNEIPRTCASSFTLYSCVRCNSTTSRKSGRNRSIALLSFSFLSICA
jgi:hypothetical protein